MLTLVSKAPKVLYATCHTCRVQHPSIHIQEALDFAHNHPGHDIDIYARHKDSRFVSWFRRWFYGTLLGGNLAHYRPNADVKIAYGSSSDLTITLASLPTSSTLVAGRESTEVDNASSVKYLDYLCGGKITTGTSPTDARQIRTYIVAPFNDSTYPDVFDGTDSNETWTSTAMRDAAGKRLSTIATNNTSDRTYPFGPESIAQFFGGSLPKKFVAWVTHDTGVNFNSTGSNHVISVTPVYATVS